MKRIIMMILAALCLASCAKPDVDPAYDMEKYPIDCSVIAAYCTPAESAAATQITGEVSTEPDADGKYTIEFKIPKAVARYYDLTRLKIRFSLDYDVYVSPALTGIHDLDDKTEEYKVYSPISGDSKIYTVKAYKTRN